jgi:hypothetical protein
LAEKAQAVVEAVSQIAAGDLPKAEPVSADTAISDNPDIKRGRVLSAKNETILRQAVDLLIAVLSQLATEEPVADEAPAALSVEPAVVAAVLPTPDPPSPVLDGVEVVLAEPTPSPLVPTAALSARDLDDLDAYIRGRVQRGMQVALAQLTGRLPD